MDARPDQKNMEQAINKFLQLLEMQDKKGFKDLATGHPTVTFAQACTRVSLLHVCGWGYAGWFLPALYEDQGDMFTPSDLRLYQHAGN